MKLITIILLTTILYSCASLPCGSPKQVERWERKKFRAQIKVSDSCRIAKMLAMARKY